MMLETYTEAVADGCATASIESPNPNLYTLWAWENEAHALLAEATSIRDLEEFAKLIGVKEVSLKALEN